ncbi:MucR family transcriptional regulator [Niveispirillum sp. KHB5.9]|uniref:MucR family transcriptional regulator n=1 Tax=Niveispirillum sp. KHB5.9 TaxID=3400269 RepID=UPI003A84FBE8
MEQQGNEVLAGDLLRMTAEIVSAYVGQNTLATQQLPDVINAVYATLTGLQGAPVEVSAEPARPAVPIKKSVTPEYIVCLEDGKKLKMLKRHLRSTYDMSPDEYRAKWGLPPDYPMVAPNYAAQRSEFAKKIGLGRGDTRTTRRRG